MFAKCRRIWVSKVSLLYVTRTLGLPHSDNRDPSLFSPVTSFGVSSLHEWLGQTLSMTAHSVEFISATSKKHPPWHTSVIGPLNSLGDRSTKSGTTNPPRAHTADDSHHSHGEALDLAEHKATKASA